MTPERIDSMLEDVSELRAHSQSTLMMHSDDVLALLRIAKAARRVVDERYRDGQCPCDETFEALTQALRGDS